MTWMISKQTCSIHCRRLRWKWNTAETTRVFPYTRKWTCMPSVRRLTFPLLTVAPIHNRSETFFRIATDQVVLLWKTICTRRVTVDFRFLFKGVRSLQFGDNTVSAGTGNGTVSFFDLRFTKHGSLWKSTVSFTRELFRLHASPGWLVSSSRRHRTSLDLFGFKFQKEIENVDETNSNLLTTCNSIFTHEYSPSKSNMIMAGGALCQEVEGNYCGVWTWFEHRRRPSLSFVMCPCLVHEKCWIHFLRHWNQEDNRRTSTKRTRMSQTYVDGNQTWFNHASKLNKYSLMIACLEQVCEKIQTGAKCKSKLLQFRTQIVKSFQCFLYICFRFQRHCLLVCFVSKISPNVIWSFTSRSKLLINVSNSEADAI